MKAIPLLVGLIAGGILATMVLVMGGSIYASMLGIHAERQVDQGTVFVLVFATSMPAGVTIGEEHLYAVELSARTPPDGVFFSPEHVVGMVTSTEVLDNEFVRHKRLIPPEGPGLKRLRRLEHYEHLRDYGLHGEANLGEAKVFADAITEHDLVLFRALIEPDATYPLTSKQRKEIEVAVASNDLMKISVGNWR